jgi:predicted nucleic acid-binding protein
MLLIDTSVWITVFRDRTGQVRQQLETLIDNRDVLLTRFTQLELLQGSLDEKEWNLLSTYLDTQDYIEPTTICAGKDSLFGVQLTAVSLKLL